ncbi:N-acetyl-gamma-glutamyl-phosphate reductase [Candidatus Spongiihabitans sp.]|uniref:N-acetyl-gamma-glutamyl-phosphate reductase n=1 Tax=Candidatus Spongiihabitans sp. TaxID=3101308 RepID=UPI003C6FF899
MEKLTSIKIGIMGGTGYAGIELLRILANHPYAQVTVITSRGESGQSVSEYFPSLRGRCSIAFSNPDNCDLTQCDVVFSATPKGVAMRHAEQLIAAGIKFIDLSADFRLKDAAEWETWYGMKHHCPKLIAQAVYGLPEIYRERISDARLVANPGCYPAVVQLGFLPLLENNLIETDSLIADAKSGVSGAGRKAALATSFAEVSDSFKAYAVSGHRHFPEIKQGLQAISNHAVELIFTPHLLPMIRGIHATLYARLTDESNHLTTAHIQSIFERRFEHEPFVDVLPSGSHPDTRSVRGSNHCQIAVHRPQEGRTVVVLAVEDNLVKGAAGQAVQNMNLMFGLDETCGLQDIALVP